MSDTTSGGTGDTPTAEPSGRAAIPSTGPVIHSGLALADHEVETETNAHLRRRLAIFYRVLLISGSVTYALWHVTAALEGTWGPGYVLRPTLLLHLVTALAIGALLVTLLRSGPLGRRALRTIDVLGIALPGVAILLAYAVDYAEGPHMRIGMLALLIVARAVAVPSTARTTFLLAAPAPAALLAIQLGHGAFHDSGGHLLADDLDVAVEVLWTHAVLGFGIAIAAVASRVNFALRIGLHEAVRLGQYHLEKQIGSGGMGRVYRATHAMLRRPTAVKILRPEVTGERNIERFEREVRHACRLTSPNTVEIYDFGQTADGLFYYAMELLDGADLRAVVEHGGPLHPGRVIHLLSQVCEALAEAHAIGLVHRDLKPGNIVVCHRGGRPDVAKVVDFGLVKSLETGDSTITRPDALVGSPETVAPEMLRGEPLSPSVDLYALGVVGHFTLTGHPAFEVERPMQLLTHHLYTEPTPPSALNPRVPADLEAIVLRCLRKKPEERFASAEAVQEALGACADAGTWDEELAEAWWREFRQASS